VKAAGIICEYNPIHPGHIYHIRETRRLLGEDTAIVCVMSGNFVQRGEPAMFPKHARAEAAVRCGADLVLELPLPWAISSAEGFARGGVFLLDALGCVTHLSFGSEAGHIEPLLKAARALDKPETLGYLKEELQKGISFAAARTEALRRVLGEGADVLLTPNNTLGIEYLRALERLNSPIVPVTIRRKGAGHDEAGAESASHIRRQFQAGREAWDLIPEPARPVYREEVGAGRGPVFPEALEVAVLSRLRMLPPEAFASLPDATEGLERRLLEAAATGESLEDIARQVKTKRYALSRVRRMLLCAALGVTKDFTRFPPPYIRVLALGERGREILAQSRRRAALPVVTKPAAVRRLGGRALEVFRLEAAATDLYALAFAPRARRGGQEWTKSPVLLRRGG